MADAILALDQGTTSSRAIVFDSNRQIICKAQQEFPQHFPQIGWVEHDPEDIWQSTLETARKAFDEAEAQGYRVVALGITNQRETSLVWERETGKPIANALVWQDRRTSDYCRHLKDTGCEELITDKTGLLADPYFSASKIRWLLDHVEGAREQAETGKLAFGTVDSFLLWRLTHGAAGGASHATDATNASRTSIFNIHNQQWDEDMLRQFNIPRTLLPEVKDCAADFGMTQRQIFGREIPVLGIAGDQQAASIGQACFSPGDVKSTYGTGCFVLLNTGDKALRSRNKLLTTVQYRFDGKTTYALEGSIFIAGAVVQWLRDALQIISSAEITEELAQSVEDTGGVYFVPAFTGLGAPWWDSDARGAIYGLSRGTGIAELTRAALESVCYQTHDLITAMRADNAELKRLRVDGGMSGNDWVMQFLADILGAPVDRPKVLETTALGAATLAGMKAGLYGGVEELASSWQGDRVFEPSMSEARREALLAGWQDAVARTLTTR
jgi:glycerol kinase